MHDLTSAQKECASYLGHSFPTQIFHESNLLARGLKCSSGTKPFQDEVMKHGVRRQVAKTRRSVPFEIYTLIARISKNFISVVDASRERSTVTVKPGVEMHPRSQLVGQQVWVLLMLQLSSMPALPNSSSVNAFRLPSASMIFWITTLFAAISAWILPLTPEWAFTLPRWTWCPSLVRDLRLHPISCKRGS